MSEVLQNNAQGLYCPGGDFLIDPWVPAKRAVITHAHGDHARGGSASYLCSAPSVELVRSRVGPDSTVHGLPYGEKLRIGDVLLSFHPAGHVLGSAQVRIERGGEVWVVSGDYKTQDDPTCAPIEPQRCDAFVTESTFALPVYRWEDPRSVTDAIRAWWAENRERGVTSILYAYALGKAQRILASLADEPHPFVVHGAVERFLPFYANAGVGLPPVLRGSDETAKQVKGKALVVAPPSAMNTPWARKFGPSSQAFASGWMRIRGHRRRKGVDRGFPLSDHADWTGLLEVIEATGAQRVLVTHGHREPLARWLVEHGREVELWRTAWEGDEGAAAAVVAGEAGEAGDDSDSAGAVDDGKAEG